MLRNIVGEEALPSKDLLDDLRALCSVGPATVTELIGVLPRLLSDEGDETDIADAVARLEKTGVAPEIATKILSVCAFLSKQWARNKLTGDQVIEDLRSLEGVDDGSIEKLKPLLSAIESRCDAVDLMLARRSAIATGLPRIESAICKVDARAIFHSDKPDPENESYYAIRELVPLVVLEIFSELNDSKKTHSFQLTERHLTQLCEILERAQQRVQSLKKAIPSDLLDSEIV